ncbi:catalase family peroxidase [Thermomonas sp.]|uniref:catalase family peroxidase n=1 Tax=Thermomonas sp. TaxID=1971895 RepID=UPI0035B077D9
MSTPPPPRRRPPIGPLAAIATLVAVAGTGFLYAAGRLGDTPPTARTLIGAIEAAAGPHPGYRRAHSRGVCVGGWFTGTPEGTALSSARVFTQDRVPVLGRLSIGGGDPHGAEAGARVRSLALQLRGDDGADWRLAMNSFPFFAVPTAEAFLEQTRAQIPNPATGKPDPARMAAVLAKYPSARAFRDWAARAPWPDSWANTTYNGIHTFVFIAPDGHRQPLRWSLRPRAPLVAMDAAARAAATPDYLAAEFARRLAAEPVAWDLVATLPAPGDALDDPSQPWPASRPTRTLGTLWLDTMTSQAEGACRDVNFDPTVLPPGIEPSDDPILAARAAVYAQSFNRREREIARGQAPEATGQGGPR